MNWWMSITRNKTIEVEAACYRPGEIFVVRLEWTRRRDHAGLVLYLELFGRSLELNFHDNRHWNNDEDRWCRPGEHLP